MKKRLLSMLLVLCMVFSLVPAFSLPATAAEGDLPTMMSVLPSDTNGIPARIDLWKTNTSTSGGGGQGGWPGQGGGWPGQGGGWPGQGGGQGGATASSTTYTCQLYLPGNVDTSKVFFSWDDGLQASVDGKTYASGACPVPAAGESKEYTFTKADDSTAKFTVTTFQGSATVKPIFIDIDESKGTIAAMDGDRDHETSCSGLIYIDGVQFVMSKIKGRGNYTWSQARDKKAYNISLDTKVSILGIDCAPTKKWSILAEIADHSLLCNRSGFALAHQLDVGQDTASADVWMNGEYQGCYTVTPKYDSYVTKDGFLIENDNYKESLTVAEGGDPQFALEGLNAPGNNSQWGGGGSDYNLITVKGIGDNLLAAVADDAEKAAAKIQSWLQDAWDAIRSDSGKNAKGKYYTDYIDIESFAKMYLMHEYVKSYDVCAGSILFHRDGSTDDYKLIAGPVWDLDNAMGSTQSNGSLGSVGDRRSGRGAFIPQINEYKTSIYKTISRHEDFMEEVYRQYNLNKAAFDSLPGVVKAMADDIETSAMMNHQKVENIGYNNHSYGRDETLDRGTEYEQNMKRTGDNKTDWPNYVSNLEEYVKARSLWFANTYTREDVGFVATVNAGQSAEVTTYAKQADAAADQNGVVGEKYVYATDPATGEVTKDGNGQINFRVNVTAPYQLDGVTVEPAENFEKLETVSEGLYRVTKVTGPIAIKVATSEVMCEHEFGDDGVCTKCGREACKIVFDCDAHCSVTSYDTQDLSAGGRNDGFAFGRDSKTGAIVASEGQLNFVVNVEEGYAVNTVVAEPAGGYNNLKDPADANVPNSFRLTKVVGSFVLHVTTKKVGDPVTDYFADGDYNEAAWTVLNEDKASYSVNKGEGIVMPTQEADIYSTGAAWKNAFVTPTDGDWKAVTKVVYPKTPTANYQQGMMLVWQDEDNYIRINCQQSSLRIEPGKETDGSFSSTGFQTPNAQAAADGSVTLYYMIEKAGNNYTLSYSQDGLNFTGLGSTTADYDAPKIGLFASQNSSNEPIDVYFEYLAVLGHNGVEEITPERMLAWANQSVADYLFAEIPAELDGDLQLSKAPHGYDVSVGCDFPEILDENGKFTKPDEDTQIKVTLTVSDGINEVTTSSVKVLAKGKAAAVVPIATFVTDAHCSVTAYDTSDLSGEGHPNATSALARDKATGNPLAEGGQIWFVVQVDPGYEVDTVTAEPASSYNKLKDPADESVPNSYNLTKVVGDFTVTVTTKAGSVVPVLDTAALEKAISDAEKVDTAAYTDASVAALNAALAAARDALSADTQAAIDAAAKALNDAIAGLVAKPVLDKSALEKAISDAEKIDTAPYTDESVAALNSALNAAKAARNATTQAAIDAAAKALNDAIAGLVVKPVEPVDPYAGAYKITAPHAVKASRTRADAGDTVVVTADETIAGVTAQTADGKDVVVTKSGSNYTFTMPAGDVSLKVYYASTAIAALQKQRQQGNPFIPIHDFNPDTEPHIWEDPDNPGQYRFYFLSSHDMDKNHYCSNNHVLYSCPVDDPFNWTYHGVIVGPDNTEHNDILYAPDMGCVEDPTSPTGKYYYYYPCNQAGGRQTMVLRSSRPDGKGDPFTVINWADDSHSRTAGNIMTFDPSVFVDDDGKVYGYWGGYNSSAHGAQLDETMFNAVPGTQVDDMFEGDGVRGGNFGFFEASSMRKIGDTYVFVYSSVGKSGDPYSGSYNHLAYAYGKSPLGPWTYGGVIVEATAYGFYGGGNTHGSLVKLGDQWYITYHRNVETYARQAMISPVDITIDENGAVKITEAEVSSEGLYINGLNPYVKTSLGTASYTRNCRIRPLYEPTDVTLPIINVAQNTVVGVTYFDFNTEAPAGTSSMLNVDLIPNGVNATMNVWVQSANVPDSQKRTFNTANATKIGEIQISADMPKEMTTLSVDTPYVDQLDGKYGVFYTFSNVSGSGNIAELYDMQFEFSDHEHEYDETIVAPKCLEGGYTLGVCKICGKELKYDYTEALGHDWDDGVVTVKPTATTAGVRTFTCKRCGETKTARIPRTGSTLPDDIDFANPDDNDKYEIIGKLNSPQSENGLVLTATRNAIEDCAGQNTGDNANTPEDLIEVPVDGDWTATLEFGFNPSANNGYYQFFGFYAAEGDDYQNMVGIRGGDNHVQDFIRVDGAVTADTDGIRSAPGLDTNKTYWLRIDKAGDTYTCLRSDDGETFTEMFAFADTGIEAEKIVIDAYTGMTEGYTFTLKSLLFEGESVPVLPEDIDFKDPADNDKYEFVGKLNSPQTENGVVLTATRNAIEDCNGQNTNTNATTPEDLIEVPVFGDWTATLKFGFNPSANNGYYQFFGFYAAEGEDYQNMAGIRGGDGALQNFLRVDGAITADSADLNSAPGLDTNKTYWFRIQKEADNYTCFRSDDGETFTEMFSYKDTGIDADKIVIDAYTGMTEGYTFTLDSLTFEGEGGVTPQPCEHDYQAVVTAPTCTEAGYTTYTCSKCGDSYVADEVAALGHDWGEGVITKEPTETEKGERTYTCSRCGEKRVEEIPELSHVHDYKPVVTAPTCTEAGYTTYTCAGCGDSYKADEVPALGHSFGAWNVSKAATCTAKGEETRTCSRCGEKETREIDALGHDYKPVVTAPTCTEGGYTTYTCSRCGDSYRANETPATGHSFGAWETTKAATCTEKGEQTRTCSKCGEKQTREIDALGHDYKPVVTAPTCTEGGYTTYTCSRCDDSYRANETPATGHSFGDWVVTKAATCTAEGEETRTCAKCDVKETRPIAKVAHNYVDGVCTVCGEKDPNYVPPVDYSALNAAIADAEKVDKSKYTDDSVAAFEAALAAAKAAQTADKQADVDKAKADLDAAKAALVEKPVVNYDALNAAIADAEKVEKSKYTEDTVAAFEAALAAAKAAQTADKQADVDKAVADLDAAIKALKEKPVVEPFRFDDVKDAGKFYFEPVYWAYEHEPQITKGTSEKLFSPDAGCTRGQVVTFLWRAMNEPEPTSTKNPFEDVKTGAYYYKAVLWAVEKGITKGTSDTTFRPDQTCTRGQIVTFLYRAQDPKPELKNKTNPFKDVAQSAYYYDAVLWAVENEITKGKAEGYFRPELTCTRGEIVTFLYRAMAEGEEE